MEERNEKKEKITGNDIEKVTYVAITTYNKRTLSRNYDGIYWLYFHAKQMLLFYPCFP